MFVLKEYLCLRQCQELSLTYLQNVCVTIQFYLVETIQMRVEFDETYLAETIQMCVSNLTKQKNSPNWNHCITKYS